MERSNAVSLDFETSMMTNAADSSRFRIAQRAVELRLSELGCPVAIAPESARAHADVADLDEAERRARGQRILEVYFGQLRGSPVQPTRQRKVGLKAATPALVEARHQRSASDLFQIHLARHKNAPQLATHVVW